MIYLGLSISISAFIFIIFKGFSKFNINNFQAITINYFVACSLGLLFSDFNFGELHELSWLPASAFIGILFISLFTIMAIVSQKQGVSVASVAVKMSVVIPVAAGVLLHNDNFSIQKVIAIAISLVAIVLVSQKNESSLSAKALLLPIILFFGNGSLDALLKYSQAEWVPSEEITLFTSLSFGAAGVWGLMIFPLVNKKRKIEFKNIIAGFVLGIPNFGTIYFLLKALEATKMESSVFFPINNIGIVLGSTLLSILIFKEKLSTKNWIGIAVGLLSILLISV